MIKKIKSIVKNGLDPIMEGRNNYQINDPEIEALAKSRLKDCKGCLKKEPISFLRIKDERIPELSEMMCSECECSAPYLFRQSIKTCSKWRESTNTSKEI